MIILDEVIKGLGSIGKKLEVDYLGVVNDIVKKEKGIKKGEIKMGEVFEERKVYEGMMKGKENEIEILNG